MLFPLPLTPFEYYYWCDDRPEYPTTFPVELAFSHRLHREPFDQAVRLALQRHPLLIARIDTRQRWPAWILPAEIDLPSDWSDTSQPIAHVRGEWIDLKQEAGLRIWVRPRDAGSRVLCQFHHACCDAVGALRFAEDLLIAYAFLLQGRLADAPFPPLNPERLRLRGDFGLTEAGYRRNLRDDWTTARLWVQLLRRQPALLPAPSNDRLPGPTDYLGFVSHPMDAGPLRQLREIATRQAATLNDLLLRDMFLTLRSWTVRWGERRNPWLRLMMPTNLRRREDQDMPAANVLAFTFLNRRSRDCRDPAALLQTIRSETEAIRRGRLGLYFLGGLGFASAVSGLVPWMLRRRRSLATVVVSNVGRVLAPSTLPRCDGLLQCGDTTLEQLRGVPPIRPGTRAALALVTYGRQTTLNLRCDPHFFSREQSQEFLDAYVDQLNQTIARGEESATKG